METIFKRRSIRKFTVQKVEEEKIEKILKAAMQAPTACNQQGFEFVVIKDKEILAQLSKSAKYWDPIGKCDVGIAVLSNMEKLTCEPFWQQDLGAVTQNILLESTELGLGAVWMGAAPVKDRMNAISEILQLPPHIWPFNLIAIGYPAEEKESSNRFDLNKVHINRY